MSALIRASSRVLEFAGGSKLLFCESLTFVNASRLCTLARCVLARGLFYPCEQVVHKFEKSSVCAVVGLNAGFSSLFIREEKSFQLPRLVCPSWAQTLVHSCDERDPGLSSARHDVHNIHFSEDQDEIHSEFEFKSQGIVCGPRGT